jgi:hypothetical protein
VNHHVAAAANNPASRRICRRVPHTQEKFLPPSEIRALDVAGPDKGRLACAQRRGQTWLGRPIISKKGSPIEDLSSKATPTTRSPPSQRSMTPSNGRRKIVTGRTSRASVTSTTNQNLIIGARSEIPKSRDVTDLPASAFARGYAREH